MILFFEASALTSVYVRDVRTHLVQPLFSRERVVIAALSLVEVHSGITRARRDRRLTKVGPERASAAFDEDWPHFYQVPLTMDVIYLARDLVNTTTLKTGDSIQFAAFLLFLRKFPQTTLVNADGKIHLVADRMGVPLIDVR